MMFENKILTWDNYLKRGGMGPNICILRKMNAGIVNHLMVQCPFTRAVWMQIRK